MSRASTKANFLYSMLYQVTLMVLPLITMPYVSRVLGAEGIGTYSYTYSIAQYFLLFGMLGVENYGNRSIAKVRDNQDKRNKVFSSIYTLQLLIATISVIAYLVYVILIDHTNRVYALIQMFYVLTGMLDINWLFFGMEDFKLAVTRKMIIKIVNVICIFIFVRTKSDLWKYLLVLSLGYFIAQSSMWIFANRYVNFHFVKMANARVHLKDFIILFIPMIATSIYRMMDKVMLGVISSMEQVGFYENSEKLISVCLCVISAFGAVMMPRMSNMFAKGKSEECKDLLIRSMEIAIFFGNAIAFGIAAVASDFIPIFYGDGYEECIHITIMLASTVIFITWACIVRTLYLIPAEKNKIYIKSVFLGVIVNVIVNMILIPNYESVGAAVATIAAEISVAVFQTVSMKNELNVFLCLKKSMPFVIFGIIMYVVVLILPFDVNGSVFLLLTEIVVGAFTYLLLSSVYFYVTKNKLLYDILGKIHKIMEK